MITAREALEHLKDAWREMEATAAVLRKAEDADDIDAWQAARSAYRAATDRAARINRAISEVVGLNSGCHYKVDGRLFVGEQPYVEPPEIGHLYVFVEDADVPVPAPAAEADA